MISICSTSAPSIFHTRTPLPQRTLIALRHPLPLHQHRVDSCLTHLLHQHADEIVHRLVPLLQLHRAADELQHILLLRPRIRDMLDAHRHQPHHPELFKAGYELLKVHPIAKYKALVAYAQKISGSEKNKLLSSCLLMPLFHTLETVVNLYW